MGSQRSKSGQFVDMIAGSQRSKSGQFVDVIAGSQQSKSGQFVDMMVVFDDDSDDTGEGKSEEDEYTFMPESPK